MAGWDMRKEDHNKIHHLHSLNVSIECHSLHFSHDINPQPSVFQREPATRQQYAWTPAHNDCICEPTNSILEDTITADRQNGNSSPRGLASLRQIRAIILFQCLHAVSFLHANVLPILQHFVPHKEIKYLRVYQSSAGAGPPKIALPVSKLSLTMKRWPPEITNLC